MAYKRTAREIELCKRVPLHDYYNTHVQPLKKGLSKLSKSSVVTICPFHDEKDPSMHYWYTKRTFKCFGKCGISGDLIAMHMNKARVYDKRSLTRQKAFEELCHMYNCDDLLTADSSKIEVEVKEEDKSLTKQQQYVQMPEKKAQVVKGSTYQKHLAMYSAIGGTKAKEEKAKEEEQQGGICVGWFVKENRRLLGLAMQPEDKLKAFAELDMIIGLKDGELIT